MFGQMKMYELFIQGSSKVIYDKIEKWLSVMYQLVWIVQCINIFEVCRIVHVVISILIYLQLNWAYNYHGCFFTHNKHLKWLKRTISFVLEVLYKKLFKFMILWGIIYYYTELKYISKLKMINFM